MIAVGLWPVVQRELRASSRQPLNHWLRLTGVALGVNALYMVKSGASMSDVGV